MATRVEVLCRIQLPLPGVSHMAQPGPAVLFRVSGSIQGTHILLQVPSVKSGTQQRAQDSVLTFYILLNLHW